MAIELEAQELALARQSLMEENNSKLVAKHIKTQALLKANEVLVQERQRAK